MKIDGPNNIVNLDKAGSAERAQKNEKKKETSRVQGGGQTNTVGDIVNISSKASEIHELKSMIENIPDIRESRMDSIEEEVSNGEYKVNSDQVAHAMIRENILDHLL